VVDRSEEQGEVEGLGVVVGRAARLHTPQKMRRLRLPGIRMLLQQ
jgi:hypothetical protein